VRHLAAAMDSASETLGTRAAAATGKIVRGLLRLRNKVANGRRHSSNTRRQLHNALLQ
jgi:hypothetical protein